MTSWLTVTGLVASRVWGTFDLSMYVLKLLAVVGGATVGGLVAGWGLRVLVRLSVQRALPRRLVIPVQLLGAITSGFAIWTVAFQSSGSALGLGGLWGRDSGTGPEVRAKNDLSTGTEDKTQPREDPPEVPRLDSDRDSILRIEMLGGPRVLEQRFYLIEGERDPKNFSDLSKAILERRQREDRRPLRALEILVYEDSVAKNHSAVRNLEKWALEQGLAVILPSTKGSAP